MPMSHIAAQGQWAEDSAGGCDLHPTWRRNPRYLLVLSAAARVRSVHGPTV